MEDFTAFFCYELKFTMKKMEKFLAQRLEAFGVNFAQSLILLCLLEEDGSILSEIGSRAQIENSSLTSMADKLERKGLVERRLDAQDRRIIRVFLTAEGRKLAEALLEEGKSFNRYLEAKLGGLAKPLVESLHIISQSLE
jgi:MarR family transcriptional regulator, organic hydroperoxide resistance regulator